MVAQSLGAEPDDVPGHQQLPDLARLWVPDDPVDPIDFIHVVGVVKELGDDQHLRVAPRLKALRLGKAFRVLETHFEIRRNADRGPVRRILRYRHTKAFCQDPLAVVMWSPVGTEYTVFMAFPALAPHALACGIQVRRSDLVCGTKVHLRAGLLVPGAVEERV